MKKKIPALLLAAVLVINVLTAAAAAAPDAEHASGWIADGTTFRITQYTTADVRRPVEVLYSADNGEHISYYLRTTPWLDVEGAPNGGGALGTSKLAAAASTGEEYVSFCADIGAVGVKGTYTVDEESHGFSDEQMHSLIAAIDYIYNADADLFAQEYERTALAQLVVWNMILMYTDSAQIADNWIRNKDGVWLYTDGYGEICRILGYNNTNGSDPWYTPGYKALINDILANTDKYAGIYDARFDSGMPGKYVSNAAFLKGDKSYADIYQQRQLIIEFSEAPDDDDEFISKVNLAKMVSDDYEDDGVIFLIDWLLDQGYFIEIFDIIADISFELYYSDAAGIEYDLATAGQVGIDSMITFNNSIKAGWYLVREVMGPEASAIFADAGYLLVYISKGEIEGGCECVLTGGGDGFTYTDAEGSAEAMFINTPR